MASLLDFDPQRIEALHSLIRGDLNAQTEGLINDGNRFSSPGQCLAVSVPRAGLGTDTAVCPSVYRKLQHDLRHLSARVEAIEARFNAMAVPSNRPPSSDSLSKKARQRSTTPPRNAGGRPSRPDRR